VSAGDSSGERMIWQCVMLIQRRRLECDNCGALALFLMNGWSEDDDREYEALCRDCFEQAQKASAGDGG
jgi:predicted amidophosphoribosyltransferase